MNYGAGNWRRIRKQQLSASLITENPKYKRDEKHKLNITIPLSYLSLMTWNPFAPNEIEGAK